MDIRRAVAVRNGFASSRLVEEAMSPVSACPRCQTHVSYDAGTAPVCHSCGYPGADKRSVPLPPPQAAWGAADQSVERPHLTAAPPIQPPMQHGGWTSEPEGPSRKSGKAVAALVLGISSYFLWVFGIITAILAIIFGAIARKEIRASQGQITGTGMANWGLWLGIVFLVIIPMLVLASVVFVLVSDLGGEPAEMVTTFLRV